ncbi:MAG TPA: hypothetical protein VII06_10365 [Chloroflexota bacterium]|jgi:hypothetical protein
MMAEQRAVAVGIFHDRAQVRDAVGALKDAGFGEDDVELLLPTPPPSGTVTDTSPLDAAAAEPSEGPSGGIGANALDNTLGNVPTGAGPGVVASALRGYGIADDEVQRYEAEARQGATLLAVRVQGRYDEAEALLRRHGAFRTTETPAARASALLEGKSATR